MKVPTINFVETMRGQVTLTNPANLPVITHVETGDLIETAVAAGRRQGLMFPLVLRDLAVSVINQHPAGAKGLSGTIESGTIFAPRLSGRTLTITRGEFELLPEVAEAERRLRYRLQVQTVDGRRSLFIYGFKRVAHHSGWWPLSLWRETTTLYVTIYEGRSASNEPGSIEAGQPIAAGIARLYPLDFIKQMLTMRSRGPSGWRGHGRNLGSFLVFFVASLRSVYWHKREPEQVLPP